MFTVLLIFFIAFIVVDALVGAAVLYHLRRYTLPGWTAARVIVPAYLGLSLALLGLALYSFSQIPWTAYLFWLQ